ncbi:MAG TPA: PorV/PorQ family protein, partial [Bacteroidota bacterium]|nr:PorV/PorQ family protein [Bacteroidota bacterium]
SIGLNLSNLGPKMTYIDAAQADPLPTNLRLGIAAQIIKSEFNNVNFVVDFARLLVRRYPSDTVKDAQGGIVSISDPRVDDLPKSLFSAWGDHAFDKVTIGTGIEYWYGAPKLIALRFGYFYENPQFGNRKFLTFGAGVRYDVYGFDFSYLSAVEENHPLGETLRFTLLIAWGQ